LIPARTNEADAAAGVEFAEAILAGLSENRMHHGDEPPPNRQGSGARIGRMPNFDLFPGKFRYFLCFK
jgi:hypothetical protein